MPKINNPGCGCCQPPCLTQCADGSTDEIAEWEWSIADLTNEVYAYIKLDFTPIFEPPYWRWFRLKIVGNGAPLNQGLAELNGIYIITHDLVTCQKPQIVDTNLVNVEIAQSSISTVEDFCPDIDEYTPTGIVTWIATAVANEIGWFIYFDRTGPAETDLGRRLRVALNVWSNTMFDVRPAFGGDGLCVSKTYQAQPPWVPDSCTVDETRQTFNNVYTVTPA